MVIISPIFPEPVLKLESEERRESYLVISDLHLGFISKYKKHGVFFDYNKYLTETANQIITIGKKNGCSNLIILGDLKDNIGYIDKDEWSIIPDFFNNILPVFDVYFVPGNHDSNIIKVIPEKVTTFSSSGMLLEDCLLHHGHVMQKKIPFSVKKMIMGHIHPIFNKNYSLLHGKRIWIFMKVDKEKLFGSKNQTLSIIVVPTFNKIYYSNILKKKNKSVSPLINKILKDNACIQSFVFTLNGEIVGDIYDANF